jgi:antitoxin CptB
MSAMEPTDAEASVRRRRLVFRAWHRGIREMDLIMGRFAEEHAAALTDAEVEQFEQLMEAPDPDIFLWITGALPTPDHYDTPLFRRLRDFHTSTGPLHG